jgi:dihydroorotate dehydrogenase (fumarate)
MPDLTTTYLGLSLRNPLVASAGPLTDTVASMRRLEDHGIAAVVLPSLFEEQLRIQSTALDQALERGAQSFAESLTYFPDMTLYNLGPDTYLESIRKAKAALSVPVIASLNGATPGGWTKYAKQMEQAGADALELNIYAMQTDPGVAGTVIEENYCALVREVASVLEIPVAVKLGPYFTALANLAKRLAAAGASGLVLFNRFYQPDFDLEALEVVPNLHLSTPRELLLRLHWAAILHGRVFADVAITGGVHSTEDVLKCMMAGARASMVTSALLKNGCSWLDDVRAGLAHWMEEHEYESIRQMQGSMSQKSVTDPKAFERANYMRVIGSYSLRQTV